MEYIIDTKAKINGYRHSVLSLVTKVVSKENKMGIIAPNCESITKILVVRPEHSLGNQLLLLPLVTELQNQFPNAAIELFVKGKVSFTIFKSYKNVSIISLPKHHFRDIFLYLFTWLTLPFKRYNLVINVVENSNSGRLATRLVHSKNKIYTHCAYPFIKTNKHIALKPIIALRTYMDSGMIMNYNFFPKLDLRLTPLEVEEGLDLVFDVLHTTKKVIGLYTATTGEKEYDSDWWEELYNGLKNTLPDYDFVEILPDTKRSNIKDKIPKFFSPSIREMAGFIDNLQLIISTDGDIMHLANATSTTTIGLFKTTDKEVYGPYGNNNLALNTNDLTIQTIIEKIKILLEK
ncbi:glycosyltransferase family 9 protein [Flavobacterium geliluteum]|uniref:Glycosyltransferase family 9 protein n=1 Tax=Flavobacterium geliluteum TaxID=2816120 RepID=A0A940X896_9FLAO|nr:glycosyltransferase family 9 protein [Flavobacterium geliluteum]MBP4137956.1 glycosyltransferase family 9 protein [Flavobacterium geliluteum]